MIGMKKMNQRQEQIIEILTKNRKMEVNTLSAKLKVSKVTIRKDLNYLENLGLLRHAHGFAILSDPQDLKVRLSTNHQVKELIAKKAASLIHDGDTIMIESGSACALFAEQLGKSGKHVTIITISCFIADFVAQYKNIDVFLTGGKYQADSQVLVGSLAKKLLENFHVKYLFVGTDGYSLNDGFYNNNISRAEMGEMMASKADQLIILTDSTKFSHESLIHQFSYNEVNTLITDSGIPDVVADKIKKSGIKLKIVDK